jgi:hypothetical protein
MLHATRRHLLSQPHRNGHRIETDRTSDLETWDTVLRYELVDLTLGDTQQLCDIRDDEGMPSPVEAIRETARLVAQVLSGELFR